MLSCPSGRPGFGSIAIMAKTRSGSNSHAEGDDHFPGIDVLSGGNRLVFWVTIASSYGGREGRNKRESEIHATVDADIAARPIALGGTSKIHQPLSTCSRV